MRLATTGSVSGVVTGAFKNVDGSLVVVFTNSGSSAHSASTVTFDGMSPTNVSAYLTDSSHKCEATTAKVSSGVATVAVPGRSVVTLKLTM